MTDKILDAVKGYNMLDGVTHVTVALSGGADSVTLTHILLTLKPVFGYCLDAVHFNHQIRGEEAYRDEQFCRDFCKKLGINLTVGSGDAVKYAKETGNSIELAARELRYRFFESVDTDVIATAHTASDNLETVLLNLTRGTGLDGLCGIPPVRGKYIRPLILCRREEIEEYCKLNNLSFVTDSTNLVDDCTRNILRHKVVPVLKSINPSVEKNVSSNCEILFSDNAFLKGSTDKIYSSVFDNDGLDTKKLLKLDTALVYRIIRRYYFEVLNSTIDSFHLKQIVASFTDEKRVSLPKNAFCVFEDGHLKIIKDFKNKDFKVNIKQIDNISTEKINNLFLKNVLDCDKIVGKLTVRTRKAGDKMQLANKTGTKSFKKLYNEYKISADERENLPVISDDEGPVWIYKIGVANRCKSDNDTKNIYYIDAAVMGES